MEPDRSKVKKEEDEGVEVEKSKSKKPSGQNWWTRVKKSVNRGLDVLGVKGGSKQRAAREAIIRVSRVRDVRKSKKNRV